MNPYSKKRKISLEQYHELAYEYLKQKEYCERCGRMIFDRNKEYIKSSQDNWLAQERHYAFENPVLGQIHHKRGRGVYQNDVNYFMAVCFLCHIYIENNRAESYEKGWLIHRNKKN